MLSRDRAAASKQWIERSGFHVRDAEYERVVACAHASVDVVAGHVVMARIAAAAVEQWTKAFVESELLREHVRALRGCAIRLVDPCRVDEARRHSASAKRGDAEHDALAPRGRRGDPNRPRIVRNRETVHAERRNVGVNLLSGDDAAVLGHPDDRIVATVQHVEVRTAAEGRIASEVPRGNFWGGRRDIDWPIDLQLLRDGNIGEAIAKNRKPFGFDDVLLPPYSGDNEVILYRDYLRAIWENWGSQVPFGHAGMRSFSQTSSL